MSDMMDQAEAAVTDPYELLVETLEKLFENPGDPAALQEALDSGALDGVSREQYMNALDQVMQENGIPLDVREQVADQLDAQPDFDPAGHLTIVIEEPDVINNIDQSLNIHGEVHGDVYQANTSNVANATGEGAIAGESVYGNQVQTGDGQQVGGDSGVQNQGDNSGQIAGGSAEADNVTSGSNNTVGSDGASRIGAEQVSQDYASIDDSAQAFGKGAADNTSTDTDDSHDSFNAEATATDSFNEYDSDTNTQTQTIEHGYEAPEYEPAYGHDDYKADDYKTDDHDDYKVDDHHGHDDYDQDATITEVD